MDTTFAVFTIFNFTVLLVGFYGVYAHLGYGRMDNSRAHTTGGFMATASTTIFLMEVSAMTFHLGMNIVITLALSVLLVFALRATISFGFELFVAPLLKRANKNPRVRLAARRFKARQRGFSHAMPHLSSR